MPEVIACPSCQRKLHVPETLVGQAVQCPTCTTTFQAKAGAPEAMPWRSSTPDLPAPSAKAPATAPAPAPELPLRSRRRAYDDDDEDDYEYRRPSRRRRRKRYDYEPHRGTLIMVLGILSFFVVPLVMGPIAWILGHMDMAAIRAGRMDPEGESQTNAGRICGMIATILWATILLLYVGFVFCMFLAVLGTAGAGAGARSKRY